MCSMAVADGLPAAGVVLISYPLHPPGKPERLRIEHLPALEVPCLFVSGTRDAFGTADEMEEHTAAIPGEVTHVWFEGKGHDLKGVDDAIATEVALWFRSLSEGRPQAPPASARTADVGGIASEGGAHPHRRTQEATPATPARGRPSGRPPSRTLPPPRR